MVSHDIMFLQRIQPCNCRTYIILKKSLYLLGYTNILFWLNSIFNMHLYYSQSFCHTHVFKLDIKVCLHSLGIEFSPFLFENMIWIWGLKHHCTDIETILSSQVKINCNSCKHICIISMNLLSENFTTIREIYQSWPKSSQFWKWTVYITMTNLRPLLPCIL